MLFPFFLAFAVCCQQGLYLRRPDHTGGISWTRYKHIHVRSGSAIHGLTRSRKCLPYVLRYTEPLVDRRWVRMICRCELPAPGCPKRR